MRMLRAVFLAALLIAAPQYAAADKGLKIEQVTSPGGIKSWLVRDSSRPIVTMRFMFRGGSDLDPSGKEGLTSLTAWMMTEGAGDMDIEAFNRKLEDDSIELSFFAEDLAVLGDLRTLTRYREKAFQMLGLALTKPRFDPDSIEIGKEQLFSAIRTGKEEPETIARRHWYLDVFPGQGYGTPIDGYEKTVEAITRDDLVAYARDRFSKDTLVVGVVGDVDPEELGRLLDLAFAGLPAQANIVNLPPAQPVFRNTIKVIEHDTTQSAAYFGGPGPRRGDPDFPATLVMIQILGKGTFTSRLFIEVRENRGLAYSVFADLNFSDRVGLIVGRVGTANASVAKSIELIREEWAKMIAKGVSEQELVDAKKFLTGSFWVPYSETSKIASRLAWVQYHGFTPAYFAERNARIEAVTREDVLRVAQKYLDPEKLYFVVVGKPDGLKSE